jgi:hypothetical protein
MISVPPLTTVGPPYSFSNNDESVQRNPNSIGSRQERQKRRRDLHYEAIDRAASRLYQYGDQDEGCYNERLTRSRSRQVRLPRLPHLPAAEQLVAPCYLHIYIDPKDNIEKASHLLKDCRRFLDIQKLCEELRSNSEAMTHPILEGIAASAQSQEHQYVPAEVYPVSRGHVNMIHKANFSKRESKKFSREIKLAEVAMASVPEYIDLSDQSILFSRADHPTAVPSPGHATLVLEAQIG